ncbi:expressed unknown protein [Seminavis robusta]|uniref:MYND-type domain-containing protein n=1 Tax=Seminavis robusta TaxID=568900 RepID=A0A9N8E9C5_9STRA|nr:expressed unknown protein [Seminavis robusta]|eukprot:Sro768_g199660.1 n/a (419) ;mRNA; f:32332-33588
MVYDETTDVDPKKLTSSPLPREHESITRISLSKHCMHCMGRCGMGANKVALHCVACKLHVYCSKECQRADWKTHKSLCAKTKQCIRDAKLNGRNRERRLLFDWYDRSWCVVFASVVNHFGIDVLGRLEHDQTSILIDLKFDYNRRTFLPKGAPSLVPLVTIPVDDDKAQERVKRADAAVRKHGSEDKDAGLVILVVFRHLTGRLQISKRIQLWLNDCIGRNYIWKLALQFMNGIRLNSRVFREWRDTVFLENLHSQIRAFTTDHSCFADFASNVLRVPTKKDSQLKTHAVMIFVEMGRELGQIKQLDSFTTIQTTKVLQEVEANPDNSEEMVRLHKTRLLDFERDPELLEERKTNPHVVHAPFVLNMSHGASHPFVVSLRSATHQQRFAASKCDKKAKTAFQELQKIKFPPVQSPPLD